MLKIICTAFVFLLATPFVCPAETIDVMIKGIDDGVQSNKQHDYSEAVMNAKLQALERAGVATDFVEQAAYFHIRFDMVENKAGAVLVPGFQIMDVGYLEDGTYQVVLVGKVKVVSKHSTQSPEIKNKDLKKATISDGRFVTYDNGVILDTKTDLEWYAGADSDTSWNMAKLWVWMLTVGGGNWKMPSMDALQTLFNTGKYSMTPLKKFPGKNVWSSKTKDFSTAFFFDFTMGREFRYDKGVAPTDGRALAVRPHKQ